MANLDEGIKALEKMGIFPKIRVVSADPVRRKGALIGTIRNPVVSEAVRDEAIRELETLKKQHPELFPDVAEPAVTETAELSL